MQVDTAGTKIKGQNSLSKVLEKIRKHDKKIVFTNGCFDLLHRGHIIYLKKAKKYGDVLVVGLNSDRAVKKLKGKGRPLTPQKERAEILASLAFVDFVVIFNELTPIRLIKKVRPHILVKGADWQKKDIVGKNFVESYGGEVKRIPYVKGYSTSALIKDIRKKCRR